MTNELSEVKPLSERLREHAEDMHAALERGRAMLSIDAEDVLLLREAARECEALREKTIMAEGLLELGGIGLTAHQGAIHASKKFAKENFRLKDRIAALEAQITDLRASLAAREGEVLALHEAIDSAYNDLDKTKDFYRAKDTLIHSISRSNKSALAIEQRIRDEALEEAAKWHDAAAKKLREDHAYYNGPSVTDLLGQAVAHEKAATSIRALKGTK